MRPIRILIVDDAVVVRQLLAEALSSDPMVAVAGVAATGRIALAKIPQVNPDLVVLDVDMPEMDGLATLAAIRETYRRLPVIMFSVLTERGAEATLDALALGATDYVTKPTNMTRAGADPAEVYDVLTSKIKTLCADVAGLGAAPVRPATAPIRSRRRGSAPTRRFRRTEIVAVGASTGGPNALETFLTALPSTFPVPIVIVQHMPPIFTRRLAERLAAKSALQICEGIPNVALQPGHVWIAPGDYHMTVARAETGISIRMHQAPPENSCRPAVDVLFRSVAATYGPGALAVVLTGMGRDGLRGCEDIREAGGQVLVQDEASSVVWGMPGFVARADLADAVLPLDQLASEVERRVQIGRVAPAPSALETQQVAKKP